MKILATGKKLLTDELKQKLSSTEHELDVVHHTDLSSTGLGNYDIIFDLDFDEHIDALKYYAPLHNKPVFVAAVKKQLATATNEYKNAVACALTGMNTLPTFINRPIAEISLLNSSDVTFADSVLKKLNWDYKLVNDRVGMITPRVICMIINEACYTLQEGTATMKDIDTSMKLGTNYPFGPFEWGDKIGIRNVYETLYAIYDDTKDERYKICPVLKTLYLKNGYFYQKSSS